MVWGRDLRTVVQDEEVRIGARLDSRGAQRDEHLHHVVADQMEEVFVGAQIHRHRRAGLCLSMVACSGRVPLHGRSTLCERSRAHVYRGAVAVAPPELLLPVLAAVAPRA